MATYLTPEEKVLAEGFAARHKVYLERGLLPAAQALKGGKPNEARGVYAGEISPLMGMRTISWTTRR